MYYVKLLTWPIDLFKNNTPDQDNSEDSTISQTNAIKRGSYASLTLNFNMTTILFFSNDLEIAVICRDALLQKHSLLDLM